MEGEGKKTFRGVGQRPECMFPSNPFNPKLWQHGPLHKRPFIYGQVPLRGIFRSDNCYNSRVSASRHTYQHLPLLNTALSENKISPIELFERIISLSGINIVQQEQNTKRSQHPQIQQKIKGRQRNITKEIPNKQNQQKEINIMISRYLSGINFYLDTLT